MTSKHAYYGMLGGIILLIGLCGAGTYFANKMIVAEGDKLLDFKMQSEVASKQVLALEQAKKDLAQYEELEKIAKAVVPQEKDQARTVLELVNLAEQAGINIVSVQFPDSELGEVAKKGAKKPVSDANLTQLTPLENLKGVYTMEITVQADPGQEIRYEQLIDYLRNLETNRRTAQVSSITIAPNPDDRDFISFSLTLTSFVKP